MFGWKSADRVNNLNYLPKLSEFLENGSAAQISRSLRISVAFLRANMVIEGILNTWGVVEEGGFKHDR